MNASWFPTERWARSRFVESSNVNLEQALQDPAFVFTTPEEVPGPG